jgi:hypothetical protein
MVDVVGSTQGLATVVTEVVLLDSYSSYIARSMKAYRITLSSLSIASYFSTLFSVICSPFPT